MLYFVTLFDKNYMSRGMSLYKSLLSVLKDDFKLFILGMDDLTNAWLKERGMKCIVPFGLQEMKDHFPILSKLENERTHREFCWTLSSFSIQYVIDVYNVPCCIYVDSDVFFYNSPQLLLDEMKGHSVMITEHNYSPQYDMTSVSGKYCVQFMVFFNDEAGRRVLEYWKSKCEEACYENEKDGVFGDQMYLNDWESRFAGDVYNCRSIGCGVAPWNMQKYHVVKSESGVMIQDKVTRVTEPLVFFHFHGLCKLDTSNWKASTYKTLKEFKNEIYVPYIQQLLDFESKYPIFESSGMDYSRMNVYRFAPIPYLGESHFSMRSDAVQDNDNLYRLYIYGQDLKKELINLLVYVSNDRGKWLRIVDVSDQTLFSNYLHEIIWMIQRRLCYWECEDKYEKMMNEIFKRIFSSERVMTECEERLLLKDNLVHPYYTCINIVRVWKSDSNNCVEQYDDIIHPDEVLIAIE